jgi:3-isopropylmalate dehydratase small subunit
LYHAARLSCHLPAREITVDVEALEPQVTCRLVPIVLPDAQVKWLYRFGGQELTVDLEAQTIEDPSEKWRRFRSTPSSATVC